MKRIIGLGAGGHAQVILEILQQSGAYEVVGLLDSNPALHGTRLGDVPILGGDDQLARWRAEGIDRCFIGVGSVGPTRARQQLCAAAKLAGFELLRVVHPQAVVAASAALGAGAALMARAVVQTQVQLGENVLVNTGAIIEHHAVVGDHAHVATGALLAGEVRVEAGAHIGIGAVVRQGLRIGRDAVVGAGAVVVRDVPEKVTVVGVPARVLR